MTDEVDVLDYASRGLLPEAIVGLTERERRFAEAYFGISVDRGSDAGCALPAYRRAFPLAQSDDRQASVMASHLMRSPRVVAMVTHLRVALSERQVAPAGRVTQEIERLAFSNILDYVNIDDEGQASVDLRRLTPETAAAITEIETTERVHPESGVLTRRTKIKLAGKLDALDKLVRVHGMYQDKLSVLLSSDDIDRAIATLESQLEQRRLASPVLEHEPQ